MTEEEKIEKKLKYKKEYYERSKNKEGFKEKRKEYYQKNKARDEEKRKENLKIWKENNKEYIKEYNSKRYEKNKEEINLNKKKWRSENIEKINEYRRKYQKERLKKDPLFKLISSIRNRVNSSFSKNGYKKNSKTQEIIGCSFDNFKLYLESLFMDGMSWENQGKWHLDHIIPISSAKSVEEIIKLNHFSNYQPLWEIDNIRKSNKIL